MQTQGSLTEDTLASLLQTMQSERATGTLSLENRGEGCALYFLFGHLFHASAASGQGEDVVVDALTWQGGTFKFDPRAKLPAEETIESSPSDLVAAAAKRAEGDEAGAAEIAPGQDAAAEEKDATVGGGRDEVGYTSPWNTEPTSRVTEAAAPITNDADAEPSSGYDAAGWQPVPAAEEAPSPPVTETPAYAAWSPPTSGAAATPIETGGANSPWSSPAPAPQVSTASPKASRSPRPTNGSDASDDDDGISYGRRSTDAPPLAELYPLPSGKPVYERLKSAFVDFPKLLRTLRNDTHTGYVRLTGDAFTGVLLFHDGHLLEALTKDTGIQQGGAAFKEVQRRMERGEGLLDVIDLPGDTVAALAKLLMARPLFTGLMGRFINFANLLEYLTEQRVDGSVIVATDQDCGVILLRRGEVIGAYTQTATRLEASTASVDGLADDRGARIEVKAGAGDIEGIDVEAALARPA